MKQKKSDQYFCSQDCRRKFHASKQLILPIKKQWFDMILSGYKQEEYRDIKDYWTSRFTGLFEEINRSEGKIKTIIFQNGYKKDSPWLMADCTLKIGGGRIEWGAEIGKEYYILKIKGIRCVSPGLNIGNGLPEGNS